MQYMGHSGYLESCKSIVTAAKTIAHRIRTEVTELRVLGNPPASVVAFAAARGSSLNVLEVGDIMSKRGWHLNAITTPAAVHIAVTVRCFCLENIVLYRAFADCAGGT